MAAPLNSVERALQRIATELRACELDAALIGGLAVSARAEPRTTRDVDMAVAVPDDEAAEQAIFALQQRRYTVATLIEQDRTGRLATVRLKRDSERSVYVDLLFASSGIEPEVVSEAEEIEVVEGVAVPVAQRAHLIALKVLARDDRERPQDWDDLRALLAVASDEEVRAAQESLSLIEVRGYSRSRDVQAGLARALAAFRR